MLEVTKNRMLTVAEVASRLGVTESYVCRLLRDGVMKGDKIGRKIWIVPEPEVEKFRDEPEVGRPRSRKRQNL